MMHAVDVSCHSDVDHAILGWCMASATGVPVHDLYRLVIIAGKNSEWHSFNILHMNGTADEAKKGRYYTK